MLGGDRGVLRVDSDASRTSGGLVLELKPLEAATFGECTELRYQVWAGHAAATAQHVDLVWVAAPVLPTSLSPTWMQPRLAVVLGASRTCRPTAYAWCAGRRPAPRDGGRARAADLPASIPPQAHLPLPADRVDTDQAPRGIGSVVGVVIALLSRFWRAVAVPPPPPPRATARAMARGPPYQALVSAACTQA